MDSASSDDSTKTTEPTRGHRLRHWVTSHTPRASAMFGAAYGLLFAGHLVGLASAQAGQQLCGTPIARTINAVSPLALAIVVIGGSILGYLLHAYSGFKKDPTKVKEVKDWRNRAAFTALSAPLVGKLIEVVIEIIGFGLAGCIDIIPGI